jgi:hypothetical protein
MGRGDPRSLAPDRSAAGATDLKREQPELPVIVLSMHAEDEYAMGITHGASGYGRKKARRRSRRGIAKGDARRTLHDACPRGEDRVFLRIAGDE